MSRDSNVLLLSHRPTGSLSTQNCDNASRMESVTVSPPCWRIFLSAMRALLSTPDSCLGSASPASSSRRAISFFCPRKMRVIGRAYHLSKKPSVEAMRGGLLTEKIKRAYGLNEKG